MKSGFFASVRRWAAAAGLVVAVTAPTFTGAAAAAPFAPLAQAGVPAAENGNVVQVRDRFEGRRNWRRDRNYDRGRYDRRDRGRNFGGLGLGLGLGVPLGAYLASRPSYDYGPYGYYDEGYVVRRVAPRQVQRGYAGNRHVNWCYNRYRSYRAYDNSFQPYHGSRQVCYSPYS